MLVYAPFADIEHGHLTNAYPPCTPLLEPEQYKDVENYNGDGIIIKAHALELEAWWDVPPININRHIGSWDLSSGKIRLGAYPPSDSWKILSYIVTLSGSEDMVKISHKRISSIGNHESVQEMGDKSLLSFQNWMEAAQRCWKDASQVRYSWYRPQPKFLGYGDIFETHPDPKEGKLVVKYTRRW